MNDTPRVDADELLKIGQLCSDWFNRLDVAGQKPVELFDVLYQKTAEYLRGGVSIDKARFTSAELNAAMKDQGERDDSAEVASRYVRENLRKYQILLEERGDELDSLLRVAGVHQRIVINKIESKGRNKSYYYLDLEPIARDDIPQVKLPPGAVPYRVSQLPNVRPWAKPFLKYELSGWRQSAYLGTLGAIGGFAFLLVMLVLLNDKPVPVDVWIAIAAILFLLWVFFGKWVLLIDQRIVEAPMVIVPWSVQYAQLEFVKTQKIRDNDFPVREIRLVVYDAICPVCGGRIDVKQSGREFHHRLIGACSESPREHVYSFDGVTKIGVPLRGNAYYGNG